MKRLIGKLIPDSIKPFLVGLVYGWHGNYKTWEEASKRCTGYDAQLIFNKVRESALKVKNKTAAYERDSVVFDEVQYSFPLLSGLMSVAAQNKGKLNVLDFGGGLGTSYFQNKLFLDTIDQVNWCVVEQEGFVKVGIEDFSDERLHFFNTIEECTNKFDIDLILLSGVLQYLEEPFKLIDKIKLHEFRNIIIDRTPFIKGRDRLSVQRVPPWIYKASYPCWFFNEKEFLERLVPEYDLILEFDALDKANIPSKFKGFIFRYTK